MTGFLPKPDAISMIFKVLLNGDEFNSKYFFSIFGICLKSSIQNVTFHEENVLTIGIISLLSRRMINLGQFLGEREGAMS